MNDDKAEKIALFRYGPIAPLVLETLPRGELTRRAQEVASRLYDIPHSMRRQVSVDTLLEWTLRYRRNGLTALTPKPRHDRGQTRAVAPETAALIERLKRENPHRTGAALLRELALTNEPDKTGLSASTSTFPPADHHVICSTKPPRTETAELHRLASDISPWGRRGVTGLLTPTRSDITQTSQHGLFDAQSARGITRSTWTTPSTGAPGAHRAPSASSSFIPPYQPEGRGKIERFFRSVREQFLASLDPKSLLSIEQLNERLWHWLDTVYHRREHSALQTTPLLRWQRDIEQVRQLPPATDMRRLFYHRVDRLVRRDSTFLLRNRFFEAPPQLASKRIEVRFDPLDLAHVEIYCDGKPEGAARLVDAVVNGRTYQ